MFSGIYENHFKKIYTKVLEKKLSIFTLLLLPKYKGLNTFERILKNKDKKTGCTVHFVNEKIDCGKIILQKTFYVKSKDEVKTLKEKTQKLEHKAFPEAIIKIF